jgi:hypothetical protein
VRLSQRPPLVFVGCVLRTATAKFVAKSVYSKSNVSRDVLCKLARVLVSKGLKPFVERQVVLGCAPRTATVTFVSKSIYSNSNIVVRRTHPTIAQHTLELA